MDTGNANQDVRRAVSISEAAARSGFGRDKIYQAIRDGRLIARKFGRRTLILTADLDKFLQELPNLKLV
ncbi:MAG TPA: helix-turn-helix domain-containing protein [Hyphomicrobium sp.]|jgi:excisionase family DNA binding protein